MLFKSGSQSKSKHTPIKVLFMNDRDKLLIVIFKRLKWKMQRLTQQEIIVVQETAVVIHVLYKNNGLHYSKPNTDFHS